MDQELINRILSYFEFGVWEIVALSLLFLIFAIQIYFYVRYYRKPLQYAGREEDEDSGTLSGEQLPMVSIIISSENEADNLALNLPLILDQDYPRFEVIVVNNGSTDESDDLLQSLSLKYDNIYQTFLPISNDKRFGRHKLALTIGAKAAKGDVLLFTEPYCKPESNQWVKRMVEQMSDTTEIVLGYSYYKRTSEFYNRVARFDDLLFSMQYLSKAILDKPFTGIYRNIAFKKHLFFDNKGFASHLNIENGEDLFINQIATTENTTVAITDDSFVETTLGGFSMWRQIKKNYSVAQSGFGNKGNSIFSIESATRYLFYLLFAAITTYTALTQNWGVMAIAILLFLVRWIVQSRIINKSGKYFKSGKFYLSLLPFDLIQPIYNWKFRTRPRKVSGRRGRL